MWCGAVRSSADQCTRLGRTDNEIVKVPAYFEASRLSDPTNFHGFEAGCPDQPLDFFASTVVVGRVEEDRGFR